MKDSVEVENLQDQSLSMLQHHINSGSKINGKLYLSSISIIAKVELLIFFCVGFFLIQKYLFFIISTIKEQNYYFSENYEWRGSNFIETIISGTWWWFKWICGVFDLSTAGSKLIYRFKKFLKLWIGGSKELSRFHKLKFMQPELKTLEWWISGLMLNPLFFLISRINIACSSLILISRLIIRSGLRISHSKVFSSVGAHISNFKF